MQAHQEFMQIALQQAQLAADLGEVPVGAIIVKNNQVIAMAHNRPIGLHDPSAHAEIQALRQAGLTLGNYRLMDCTLYVTLEPCAMCAGAIQHARIANLIYGASDPKTGACGSVVDLMANQKLNHHTQVMGGLMADECASMLSNFFKQRRK
jgi:tRNA(adenine34) deaminase